MEYFHDGRGGEFLFKMSISSMEEIIASAISTERIIMNRENEIEGNKGMKSKNKIKIWLAIDDMYQSNQHLLDYFNRNIKGKFLNYDANKPFLYRQDIFTDIRNMINCDNDNSSPSSTNTKPFNSLIIISAQRDVIDRIVLSKLEYLSEIIFNVHPLDNTNSPSYRLDIIQKTKNVYEVFKKGKFISNGSSFTTIDKNESKDCIDREELVMNNQKNIPLSTFNLSTSNEQKRIKELTELPFMRQQRFEKVLAEDYDEESPIEDE